MSVLPIAQLPGDREPEGRGPGASVPSMPRLREHLQELRAAPDLESRPELRHESIVSQSFDERFGA